MIEVPSRARLLAVQAQAAFLGIDTVRREQSRDWHGRFAGGGGAASAATGIAAEAAVPASATFIRVERSDRYPTGDKATAIEGVAVGRDSVTAVNTYLAEPGLINDRLRNPNAPRLESSLTALGPNATPEERFQYYKEHANLPPQQSAATVAKADRAIAGLDRVMAQSRLSQDVITYRGVDGAGARAMALPSGDATGHTWTDAGFVSTSSSRGIAENSFSGSAGAVMRVSVPTGTSALSLSGLGEHEILLGRNLTFTVTADNGTTASGARLLDIEVSG